MHTAVVLLLLSGCATAAPTASPAATQTTTQKTSSTAAEPRQLRNYADLVRAAAARADREQSNETCLVTAGAEGYQLRGEIRSGLRPLPQPALDLDEELLRSVTVSVLTPFGRYSDGAGALTFASFSYAPPTHDAVVVVLTDRGVYVRGTRASVPVQNGVVVERAVEAVARERDRTVFVAAEAETSMDELAQMLKAAGDANLTVALAVNLAPDTRLPQAPEAAVSHLCPDGLPLTEEAEGNLPVSELRARFASLSERGAACLENADAAGAAGGKLSLAIRIGATGAVTDACLMSDSTGDARLRSCIVSEAKKLSFPTPSPAGVVDVALPLALQTPRPAAPQALCKSAAP